MDIIKKSKFVTFLDTFLIMIRKNWVVPIYLTKFFFDPYL